METTKQASKAGLYDAICQWPTPEGRQPVCGLKAEQVRPGLWLCHAHRVQDEQILPTLRPRY